MKIENLICAGAILLSFMACSQDDVNGPQGGNENGEGAYMSLAISMPNASGTRAVNTDGTTTDEGTKVEQTVNNLLVLVYADNAGATNVPVVAETFKADQLRPTKPNDPATSDRTTLYTVPAFKVESGVKKVVVIVNPNSNFTETSTLGSMRTAISLDMAGVAGISSVYEAEKSTGFLMTNANFETNQDTDGNDVTSITPSKNGDFYADGSVYVDVQGTATNPTTVTIPVERAVAKITDVTTNYTITVTNSGDQVRFDAVALVNGNTKFFPIKNIRPSGVDDNDYIVDPNFSGQNDGTRSDFYFHSFAGEGSIADADYKVLTTTNENRPVLYTLENTMTKNEQMTAFTTGLYYKATYFKKGSDINTPQNLYKFAGALYTFDELSKDAASLGLSLGDLNNDSEASAFEAKGITKYANGVCYYPYWIRHIPSTDNLGVMEFGVVRNNAYQMTIQTVKGIGTPTPEEPNTETPDESSDVMLQVLVKVLPWTVRSNGIDF